MDQQRQRALQYFPTIVIQRNPEGSGYSRSRITQNTIRMQGQELPRRPLKNTNSLFCQKKVPEDYYSRKVPIGKQLYPQSSSAIPCSSVHRNILLVA
ncbi:hypothetical protein CDAR_64301 [Caerostris darwini]|uniref:Uncharacterized protein n=1 Tax=Caerostris darwini TaxID=1538125 RepID=A0AAV4RSB0_9ARAC|nr:hypothetical protein CDAR_64301 [Caerostris darwini]